MDWGAVSAGGGHTTAIKYDGTLWAWGKNSYGQLGDDSTDDRNVSTQESTGATDWVSVNSGSVHTTAIKSDGTLWAWGNNWNGRLGDGTTVEKHVPTKESTRAADWSIVNAGSAHTAAIKSDGTLWTWGANDSGQLGDGTTLDSRNPIQPQLRVPIILRASDFMMPLYVSQSTATGDWKVLSLLNDTEATASIKTQGIYGTFSIENDRLFYIQTTETNATDSGVLEISNELDTIEIMVNIEVRYWKQVSAGYQFTVAIKPDGTLWAWGNNQSGQLGDGTTVEKHVPIQEFTGATDWSLVSAGRSHTVAIKSNGTLWAWGDNDYGQLGDGTTLERDIPTQEATGATDWSSISAGGRHTSGIKSDDTLWLWGWNYYGELGNGTRIDKHQP
ncbi:MAG: hypothetical protein U9O64_05780 [Campylobacterota bacterium]|nr:hypothetical protein [Campylobacterota bacterium]